MADQLVGFFFLPDGVHTPLTIRVSRLHGDARLKVCIYVSDDSKTVKQTD
jgi:hypothetical protein